MLRWLAALLCCASACAQQSVEQDYLTAWQRVGQGRSEEAIPLLQSVIARRPQFDPAYRALAEAYQNSRRTAEGERYFRGLIAQDPLNGAPHYGLTELFVYESRHKEALVEASTCARKTPKLYMCFYWAVGLIGGPGNSGVSVERLRQLLPFDPARAESQYALLCFLQKQRRLPEAIQAGEEALRLGSATGNHSLLASIEWGLSDAYVGVGAGSNVALQHAEAACRFAASAGDPHLELFLCRQVPERLAELERGAEAERRATDLAARARALSNPRYEAMLEGYLGRILARQGRTEQALPHLEYAISLQKSAGGLIGLVETMKCLAEVHAQRGDFTAALAAYQDALELAQRSGRQPHLAFVYAKLTVIHNLLGNTLEAIRTAQQAIAVFRRYGMFWQAGAELSDVALAYLTLGDYTTAIHYTRLSLASAARFKDPNEEVRNRNILADALLAAGNPAEAKQVLRRALDLMPKIVPEPKFELRTLTLVGESHSRLREFEAAGRRFNEALGKARQLRDAWLESDLQQRLGWHFLRKGDLGDAGRAFDASLAIAEPSSAMAMVREARRGLAEMALRRGLPEAAAEHLRRAILALESLRSLTPGTELRSGLMRANWRVYEDLIGALGLLHAKAPAAGHDLEALTWVERGRARGLLDLLEESRAGLTTGLTPAQATRQAALEKSLSNALAALRLGDSAANRAAAERAERDLALWATELRVVSPRFHDLKYPEPLDAAGVRKLAVETGATIVEYALGPSASRVWVASPAGIRSAALPPEASIAAAVQSFRTALARQPRSGGPAADVRRPARELHRILIEPVADQIPAGAPLVVVPDGMLHYLPFEALLDSAGRYLVERSVISYAPSASVFARLSQAGESKAGLDLLALANPVFSAGAPPAATAPGEVVRSVYRAAGLSLQPLPGTEREVRAIASQFPAAREKLLLGRQASEAALKRERLENYRRVHLATHALIDERSPLRSGIVLSLVDTGGEDGVLRLDEIMKLRLDSELVTLSACQTGLGSLVRGEGMVGLSRAFLFAGARRLAVSLWPVNDESMPDFMQLFYREMRLGVAPAAALQAAKLSMLRSPVTAYRHPYFWAAFVLVGRR